MCTWQPRRRRWNERKKGNLALRLIIIYDSVSPDKCFQLGFLVPWLRVPCVILVARKDFRYVSHQTELYLHFVEPNDFIDLDYLDVVRRFYFIKLVKPVRHANVYIFIALMWKHLPLRTTSYAKMKRLPHCYSPTDFQFDLNRIVVFIFLFSITFCLLPAKDELQERERRKIRYRYTHSPNYRIYKFMSCLFEVFRFGHTFLRPNQPHIHTHTHTHAHCTSAQNA